MKDEEALKSKSTERISRAPPTRIGVCRRFTATFNCDKLFLDALTYFLPVGR